MKYINYMFLSFALITLLNSCSDGTSPTKEAYNMTIDQVLYSGSYLWFPGEYESYKIDTALIKEIQNEFDPAVHQFFFYVKPSCICEVPQKPFAHIIKVLREAGIDDSYSHIYSMSTIEYTHPYEHKFNIKKLPDIFIAQDTLPKYHLMEKIDSININHPGLVWSVEELILEGLKNQ